MEWINVKQQPIPKDGKPYLALSNRVICIVQYNEEKKLLHLALYDEYMKELYIAYRPTEDTGPYNLPPELEFEITHWCKLELPEDC